MSVTADSSIVLDIRALQVAVRTDHGEGPVLVDDVSLTLRRGDVIGLIGESGAGKSTIGLASMGYTRRNCFIVGGQILFAGADLRAMTADQRRALRGLKLSYIAQSAAASFNPAMTLMDQVCEAPIRHGVMGRAEAQTAAVGLFRDLDLPNPATIGSRYPHQVSGGQLQRVMAAMAMIGKPEIIVFDEPTTALDVTTQVECLAAFRRLVRIHGAAALYITHDLAVVAQIADRIMVLQRGKMVEFGDARSILQAPEQDYTRRLVRERTAGQTFVARPQGASPLLEVAGVTAHYAGKPKVIDDVSLEIYRGDTVAVVGEFGIWKINARPGGDRALAPREGRCALRRREPAGAPQRPFARPSSAHPDDLSDAGRRPKPAADTAPGHRPAGVVLLPALAGGGPGPSP